jgi:predicted ATP-binding protein involved in virulence
MKVHKLQLNNYGPFEKAEICFEAPMTETGNVTVFIGNNGAGKTLLLKSLATALSWVVARIRNEKSNGKSIDELDIKNGLPGATVKISITDDNQSYEWLLTKPRPGRKINITSDLRGLVDIANKYREQLTKDHAASLPLLAYYPVERSVLEIPLKIRKKHSFEQIDGYDNALTQGVDFRRFFEWFRTREDAENESGISNEMLTKLQSTFKDAGNEKLWEKLREMQASARDKQLTAVREAIAVFIRGFSNLRIKRKPKLHMAVNKDQQTMNVAQLSQGEKSLMALIGDIARRLAMMNPSLENPLKGVGIVLIDEVDLHLHPRWQRSLISNFTRTFPNCQFILTSHSPLVISDQKRVSCYLLDNARLTVLDGLYGMDVNQVLLEAMDTEIRNEQVAEKLDELWELIQKSNLPEAHALLKNLEQDLFPGHPEAAKARLLLKKMALKNENDQ